MIWAMRSYTVPTGVSYTRDFRWPQKKKSKRLKSKERGGQGKSSPRPIYLLRYVVRKWSCFAIEKLVSAPSCVNHTFCCQVIYSQFGLAIHQNDHQARRRFVEWAQNEIAVVADFHKRILFSDEAHFWLNGYVNKQNCLIWSEANPQVYVETSLHPEKLTSALWAGGSLLQKR
ncbi:hypothetical protein TNCV_1227941 [Trichonephila clavipes]|nr:hypothetical protein TNCV_1227941 [Trichonephila clavipes]